MNFLAWNIRWGGQNRQDLIAAAIVARAPDVVVLTEYQPRGSSRLLSALTDAGLCHHALTDPPPRMGGVAILSRHPLAPRDVPEPLRPYDTRYLAVGIPAAKIELRGLYGLLHEEPYADYWTAVLDALESDAADDVLVLGDFNTGEPELDAPVKRLFCSQYFCELPRRGYADLWRRAAGRDAREYSWQGRVNSYRLDHAFGSAPVVGRLIDCHYSHEERLAGISDHSLLSVRIDT